MITSVTALLIASMASSLIQLVTSQFIIAISGKGVTRAEKGQKSGFFSLLALSLMIKAMSGEAVLFSFLLLVVVCQFLYLLL